MEVLIRQHVSLFRDLPIEPSHAPRSRQGSDPIETAVSPSLDGFAPPPLPRRPPGGTGTTTTPRAASPHRLSAVDADSASQTEGPTSSGASLSNARRGSAADLPHDRRQPPCATSARTTRSTRCTSVQLHRVHYPRSRPFRHRLHRSSPSEPRPNQDTPTVLRLRLRLRPSLGPPERSTCHLARQPRSSGQHRPSSSTRRRRRRSTRTSARTRLANQNPLSLPPLAGTSRRISPCAFLTPLLPLCFTLPAPPRPSFVPLTEPPSTSRSPSLLCPCCLVTSFCPLRRVNCGSFIWLWLSRRVSECGKRQVTVFLRRRPTGGDTLPGAGKNRCYSRVGKNR